MSYKLRILSLGAGVQSTTLLLMAEKGEIAPFHCAIFADAGWESDATYMHLDFLRQICKTPIITVHRANIRDHLLDPDRRSWGIGGVHIPCHGVLPDGKRFLNRQGCTTAFKIIPIHKEIRRMLGLQYRQRAPKGAVEEVIGISLDEARRMKLSREAMSVLSYPLVELGMTRTDCKNWLTRNGYPIPPKSSCIGCPYHNDTAWREVMESPGKFKEAVDVDHAIRNSDGFKGTLYLHKSCKPLDEVYFSAPSVPEDDRNQKAMDAFVKDQKLNLFSSGNFRFTARESKAKKEMHNGH